MVSFQTIVEELLTETGASRVTLRQEDPNEVFPVTHEALAPGVGSLIGVGTPNMAGQPVVHHVHEMLGLYGGLKAQIVTPVVIAGETRAIVSVHQLGRPRVWSDAAVARCREAVERVRAQLTQKT